MPESLYDEATAQISSFVHEFNQIQSSFRTELSHATHEISASHALFLPPLELSHHQH